MNDAGADAVIAAGMQNIEFAITVKLRALGLDLSSIEFTWNRGEKLLPIHKRVEVEVRARGRRFTAILSREHIEDSWEVIERADVNAFVREAVRRLTA